MAVPSLLPPPAGGSSANAHGAAQTLCKIGSLTVARNREQLDRGIALPGHTIPLPGALIAAEVEQLVFLDGATDGAAELVLLEYLLAGLAIGVVAVIEKLVGVQRFVAEE